MCEDSAQRTDRVLEDEVVQGDAWRALKFTYFDFDFTLLPHSFIFLADSQRTVTLTSQWHTFLQQASTWAITDTANMTVTIARGGDQRQYQPGRLDMLRVVRDHTSCQSSDTAYGRTIGSQISHQSCFQLHESLGRLQERRLC
jgi:hypothetical protein